ncbi:MAG: metallophosphoesterase [Chloroflexi bacterium]|nr:metallophosphoesterase [Chloroflexota bacterium]MCI0647648.1 metallophosphoesterase [Chloroflexota bacterium]MCI0731136.1 metallophosphoesterase [Chloroflexota bacterium]
MALYGSRNASFPQDISSPVSPQEWPAGGRWLVAIWLLLACLAGCNSSATPTPPPVISTGTPAPIITSATTATPIPTETATPLQTYTPTSPHTDTPTPPHTPTSTPSPTPIRFAVIGDYGLAGQPAEDVANLVKSWQPAFILTTGDNNYPYGEAETIDENIGQYYAGFIYPYQGAYGPGAAENRFFPTLGNHDWSATAGIQPYLEYFTLPGNERYYDFTWGPLHFFALDSDSREPDGVSSNSIQATWLRDELAASAAPWRLVYMHHSPYTSGFNGPVGWMEWPFQEWGASAVLAAHDHVYERLAVDGLTYFINGLGGYPARYTFENILPGSQVRYRDDYGAMLVEANEQQITFQFITRAGSVIDTYTHYR